MDRALAMLSDAAVSENFAWTVIFNSHDEVSVMTIEVPFSKTLGHREVQGLLFTERGAAGTRYLPI